MRLSYHPETDSLYIHLPEKPGADAGKVVDLSRLETDGLQPGPTPTEPRRPGRARAV